MHTRSTTLLFRLAKIHRLPDKCKQQQTCLKKKEAQADDGKLIFSDSLYGL